ncbi:MAG: LamB/YcsF family protein [Vampirovibrio sp.]|nr:LamB/YcsF family protein [Vampirovibrio sp.]
MDTGVDKLQAAQKVILKDDLKRYIDLNTDFGQSRDTAFFNRTNHKLLTSVSSVNIPCCVHDGDPKDVMDNIAKAKSFNCAIGAHIGYPDPANYGYEAMAISKEELQAWLYVQVGGFRAMIQSMGLDIEHIRPHGALYTSFLDNPDVAMTVAETLNKIDPWITLVAPVGPILQGIQEKMELRTAPEVYLGKRYGRDGVIVKDRMYDTLPPHATLEQAKTLIQDSKLTLQDGQRVDVQFSSIHISPTMADSCELAEKIYQMLEQPVPVSIAAVGSSGWL